MSKLIQPEKVLKAEFTQELISAGIYVFVTFYLIMLTPQYGRAFLRISDPQIINMGMSHIGPRVVSPQMMRSSNCPLPPPMPFRPTSNQAVQPVAQPRPQPQAVSPPKTLNDSLSKSKSGQRPSGLKLVQKNRWKKEDIALRQQLQNTTCKLQIARRNLKQFEQLKKENQLLKTENQQLKQQAEKRRHDEKAFQQERQERMNKLQQFQQQQYSELLRKYTSVEKEKDMIKHIAVELENELKKVREENMRLSHRVHEVIEINNRVRQVETHYKNLEKQFEKDIEEWNQQKRKLENGQV